MIYAYTHMHIYTHRHTQFICSAATFLKVRGQVRYVLLAYCSVSFSNLWTDVSLTVLMLFYIPYIKTWPTIIWLEIKFINLLKYDIYSKSADYFLYLAKHTTYGRNKISKVLKHRLQWTISHRACQREFSVVRIV